MRKFSFVLGAILVLSASPAAVSAKHKSKPPTTFAGAGQRLHFSFGGSIKLRNDNTKVSGNFMIIAHPAAPGGDTLSVVCTYHALSKATVEGTTLGFDAQGHCKTIMKSGEITKVPVTNHFTFVDNGATGDTIHVEGDVISIPTGELSFGDFTLTVPQPS